MRLDSGRRFMIPRQVLDAIHLFLFDQYSLDKDYYYHIQTKETTWEKVCCFYDLLLNHFDSCSPFAYTLKRNK